MPHPAERLASPDVARLYRVPDRPVNSVAASTVVSTVDESRLETALRAAADPTQDYNCEQEMDRVANGLQALVVDDSALHLHVLERTLSREFESVHKARNGSEAMAIFERERPSLVITDCMMPDFNGFELCQRIRAAQSSFVTGRVHRVRLAAITESEG
jgi:PleD family two-component response regulator